VLSFKNFIANKPLYYKKIDYKRIYKAYTILKPHIRKPLSIHIVGTNGKGSTGRIMATLLHHADYKVGHFSSPHILKFNERIWIKGEDISDSGLEIAHSKLYDIFGKSICDELSYFEYTTLLALVAMENLDVVILEAGLGGEFDATNVVSKNLSVITPIGLDHQDFLGNTIDSIAKTKLNSIKEKALLGFQSNLEVYDIANEIAEDRGTKLYRLQEQNQNLLKLTQELGWSYYLYENSLLAIEALKILNLKYNIKDIKLVNLFGRFQQILPNVIIDVGHNILASEAISNALREKYREKKIVLVYNVLDDKDYVAILKKLKKYIKRVEIIKIDSNRAIAVTQLQESLQSLSIDYNEFKTINKYEDYLVFGSFFVVEAFIKKELLQI
jgi:dihydrofolate synthase/folylpolyglutamate synthase